MCQIWRMRLSVWPHRGELWPGFDPLAVPLVFYDGDDTYLFRCSEVPKGFKEMRVGECDVLVYDGRYPVVTASSVVEIAGMPAASVMFDGSANQAPTVIASLAIHEAFHVYQQACHPTWQGNETVLYLFPVDDANLLSLRRMETEALRRALAANGSQGEAVLDVAGTQGAAGSICGDGPGVFYL